MDYYTCAQMHISLRISGYVQAYNMFIHEFMSDIILYAYSFIHSGHFYSAP